MRNIFDTLRAAVANTDPCDDAAIAELDYATDEDEADAADEQEAEAH